MNNSLSSAASNPARQSIKTVKAVILYSHSKENDALGYLRLLGPARRLGIEVIEGMEVDLVTVATSRLRDYILPFNKNVVVLPNYLNNDLWELRKPSISRAAGAL